MKITGSRTAEGRRQDPNIDAWRDLAQITLKDGKKNCALPKTLLQRRRPSPTRRTASSSKTRPGIEDDGLRRGAF
jgi:hypothetical protein